SGPVRRPAVGSALGGAARAAPVRGTARRGAPRRRRGAARADRRAPRPGGRALLPRQARRQRRARGRVLRHLKRPPAAVARSACAGGRARPGAMSVQEAYAEVGRITRREAKNFAYGIMVLPRAKRQAIAAIYAFARRVDDVADGELPPEKKRARLEELRAALEADPVDPVFVALRDARDRFGIPRAPLEALIDGGLQDIEQS